jgi:hypothetical protein
MVENSVGMKVERMVGRMAVYLAEMKVVWMVV